MFAAASVGGCSGKGTQILWESTAQGQQTEDADFRVPEEAVPETETAEQELVVDVCGAVERPGVYRLPAGARVCDAIEMAGGLRSDADMVSLNQAERLSDADKIRVYTQQEVLESAPQREAQAAGEPAKVNLNTADITQLCTLSGIGEARARDIIAYRTEHGAFSSIEEIMNVSGIKEATFHRIMDDVTVK